MQVPPDSAAAQPSCIRLGRVRRGVFWALVGAGLLIFAAHLFFSPPSWRELIPATTYTVDLDMSLEGYGDGVRVRTFLPVTDERQLILDEEIEHGNLLFSSSEHSHGREARWIGERVSGPQRITYHARIAPRGVKYELPADQPLPTNVAPRLLPYLAESPTIQVSHPE